VALPAAETAFFRWQVEYAHPVTAALSLSRKGTGEVQPSPAIVGAGAKKLDALLHLFLGLSYTSRIGDVQVWAFFIFYEVIANGQREFAETVDPCGPKNPAGKVRVGIAQEDVGEVEYPAVLHRTFLSVVVPTPAAVTAQDCYLLLFS
jgi:hypothetical protein